MNLTTEIRALALTLGIEFPEPTPVKRPVSIRTLRNRNHKHGKVYSIDPRTGARELVQ